MGMAGCSSDEPKSTDFQALAARINDDPDKLHSEMTPAVDSFIEIGRPAIPTLLDLMLSSDADTRMRAQAGLEGITMQMFGFRRGQGWSGNGEDKWRMFWKKLGSLDWQDTESERRSDIALWRQWYQDSTE